MRRAVDFGGQHLQVCFNLTLTSHFQNAPSLPGGGFDLPKKHGNQWGKHLLSTFIHRHQATCSQAVGHPFALPVGSLQKEPRSHRGKISLLDVGKDTSTRSCHRTWWHWPSTCPNILGIRSENPQATIVHIQILWSTKGHVRRMCFWSLQLRCDDVWWIMVDHSW